MKIYVEMTESEYDFYKKFKNKKDIVYYNFIKLAGEYLKAHQGNLKEAQDFINMVKHMLKKSYSLFEIKED
jgi:hypothetical protein